MKAYFIMSFVMIYLLSHRLTQCSHLSWTPTCMLIYIYIYISILGWPWLDLGSLQGWRHQVNKSFLNIRLNTKKMKKKKKKKPLIAFTR